MSTFTASDFLACVEVAARDQKYLAKKVGVHHVADVLPLDAIAQVTAAWGFNGDYSEWSGGFVGVTHDGRWFYLSGWCDTSGWG